MSNNYFSFKKFSINQDSCPMKVGTDGVLLGAWAKGGKRILDIGTGTGIIALMMAQRFPYSLVDAVEIDANVFKHASSNVSLSPYSERINVFNISIQKYMSLSHPYKYDSIVSNPPFFVDCLKNPDHHLSIGRHTEALSYEDLFRSVKRLLASDGFFSAIIPSDFVKRFLSVAYIEGFSLIYQCMVKTVERKAPKRCLLSFSTQYGECFKEEKTLLQNDGSPSQWYRELAGDFYLHW